MNNRRRIIESATDALAKELIDRGRLIEGGFAAFAHYVIPKDAPAIQLREMQIAFMAGAEHLFSSIIGILDPGQEPTDEDLRRMDLIAKELDEWRGRISERMQPAQGNA
jgi:hypothetical protein